MGIQFSFFGGWWFSAIFGMVNLLLILTSSRTKVKRLMHFPSFKSRMERIISYVSVILFTRGLIILTVFIPIQFYWSSFIIGSSLFIICLALYAVATLNFLSTNINEPVTIGMYNCLRHPMQILAIVMWIGVGVATFSWIIIAACILQFFVSYPFLIAQERECVTTYGNKYQDYMTRVNRYYLF